MQKRALLKLQGIYVGAKMDPRKGRWLCENPGGILRTASEHASEKDIVASVKMFAFKFDTSCEIPIFMRQVAR